MGKEQRFLRDAEDEDKRHVMPEIKTRNEENGMASLTTNIDRLPAGTIDERKWPRVARASHHQPPYKSQKEQQRK